LIFAFVHVSFFVRRLRYMGNTYGMVSSDTDLP